MMPPTPALRCVFSPRLRAALIGGLLAAAPFAAPAAEPPAGDDIVSLPPLMVEEKAKPLPWRYLALPGFEILSVCDDSTAMALERRHHRLDELLTVLLPERFCARTTVPETQILFNEETGRARSQEIIADMLQKEGVRTSSDGTIIRPPDNPERGGRFGRQPRIRFLPNMRLWDEDATAVFSILQEGSSTLSSFTFASDRVAFLMERRVPALPEWFVEGTLGLYARAKVGDDEIEIQPATWLSENEAKALAHELEQPRTLLPMQELFAHRRPKTAEEVGDRDLVWQAQCALFVRWAVAEQKGARREALWKFVDRLETEPLTEALFREQFGMGFAEARDRLSDYLPQAVATSLTLEGPKAQPLPRVKFRPATDVEVARLRGRWERMEISYVRQRYPAMAEKYIEQARRTLHHVYDRGERDPQLLAELGLLEIDAGRTDEARPFLEAAVQANVARPRADLELARLRYHALPELADPAATFTAAQAADILAPLLAARSDQPPLPEAYTLMGDIWTRSAVPPTAAQLAILADGVRLFPAVPAIALRAIYLHAKNGQFTQALALLDQASRHAREPAIRDRLESVRAELTAANK